MAADDAQCPPYPQVVAVLFDKQFSYQLPFPHRDELSLYTQTLVVRFCWIPQTDITSLEFM